jgi:sugar phosphate isomerase/epimerase
MHTPRSKTLQTGEGLAFRRTIEKWQPLLEGTGLRLALENKAIRTEDDRTYVLTPLEHLRAFADRYQLDLVLDTVHAATAGEDLFEARNLFDSRLANVHLSDLGGSVPLGSLPFLRKGIGQHQFPGTGDLPLVQFLHSLATDGYAGPITLEVNPFAVRFWWPPAARRYLHRAVDWLSNAIRFGPAKP